MASDKENVRHPKLLKDHSSTTYNGALFNDMSKCGCIVITVKDTGMGLSEEDLNRLFDNNYPELQLQTGQFSGLGLYVAKSVVDLHRGQIYARSKGTDQGAEFIIELPVEIDYYKNHESFAFIEHITKYRVEGEPNKHAGLAARNAYMLLPPTAEQSPDFSTHSRYRTSSLSNMDKNEQYARISSDRDEFVALFDALASDDQSTDHENGIHNVLVVEDSAACRKMVCRILLREGFACTQAVNGQDCLEVMSRAMAEYGVSGGFDLVLMDFEMPVMNGPDATKEIVRRGWTVPVIGLTGNVLPADKEWFLSCGALDVLQKPLDVTDFNDRIRRLNILRERNVLPHPMDDTTSARNLLESPYIDEDSEQGTDRSVRSRYQIDIAKSEVTSKEVEMSHCGLFVGNSELPSEVITMTSLAADTCIRRILVVDDMKTCRKMVCRLLEKDGYVCTQAENGQDCLEVMSRAMAEYGVSGGFDLVLMDFEMPVMNGPDATKEIVRRGWTVPVIGLTGNVLPADKEWFLSCGALDVLQKPLNMSALQDHVHSLQSA